MDENKKLIFRYDNTKHFPKLINAPHHKHILNKITPCKEPELEQILKEIEKIILKKT